MNFKKILFRLLLLVSIILISGGLGIVIAGINIRETEILILTVCLAVINLGSLYLFSRGRTKEPAGQAVYLLASIGTKLLFELVLAFMWFFIFKKTIVESLLLFFVLYLAFSLFTLFTMVNALKNKSL